MAVDSYNRIKILFMSYGNLFYMDRLTKASNGLWIVLSSKSIGSSTSVKGRSDLTLAYPVNGLEGIRESFSSGMISGNFDTLPKASFASLQIVKLNSNSELSDVLAIILPLNNDCYQFLFINRITDNVLGELPEELVGNLLIVSNRTDPKALVHSSTIYNYLKQDFNSGYRVLKISLLTEGDENAK